MIVSILKGIYSETGVDNDAIKKITGSIDGGDRKKVLEAIKRFKNERYPSVAVTVDLLTTGIDVPEITTLVFMRRVKSRILFEQMMGRATRLCPEIHKTHFEIYDPVGIYDSLESVNTMRRAVLYCFLCRHAFGDPDRVERYAHRAERQLRAGRDRYAGPVLGRIPAIEDRSGPSQASGIFSRYCRITRIVGNRV